MVTVGKGGVDGLFLASALNTLRNLPAVCSLPKRGEK